MVTNISPARWTLGAVDTPVASTWSWVIDRAERDLLVWASKMTRFIGWCAAPVERFMLTTRCGAWRDEDEDEGW